MSDATFDTPEFLALLRAGDEKAYRTLIRRFHGSLVGVAGAIIGSRAQAEEIVQDAWLAVFSGIGRFEGRSTLAGWIFTIVLNRARTRATREGRLVALPAVLDGAQADERGVGLANSPPTATGSTRRCCGRSLIPSAWCAAASFGPMRRRRSSGCRPARRR